MKKIYLLLVLWTLAINANSQTAASYLFTATTGTYTSISSAAGATSVSGILCDDCTQTSIPIGFSFKYCGTSYTTLSACSNGFVSLANTSSTTYSLTAGSIPSAGFLMPYWGELFGMSASAYYLTSGSSPNRVFTLEWNNFATMGGTLNFQVKLYETSNIVEFVYGTSSSSSAAYVIGISNSTTDWQTLPNTGSSPVPSSSTFTNTLATVPASGQIYRWQAKCTGTPVPGAVSATLSSGCITYSSTVSVPAQPVDVLGYTYQWKTSSSAGGPWTNVAGATNNTYAASVSASIYYTCEVGCSYSSMNADATSMQLLINAPAPITGPDTVCMGSTITLADATPGGTWASSSTSVATISTSGVVTPVAVGSTTISYTSSGCTATKNVYVNALPSAGTITGTYFVCTTPVTFTASVSGGVWGITNTAIAGVSTTGAVFAILPGLDTVTYSVTNGCGTSTAIYPINTTPCLSGVAPMSLVSGVQMEIYPNPNKGAFTLRILSNSNEPASVSVTDLLGRQIKQFTVNTNTTSEMNSGLVAGVYLISVTTPQGITVGRLVVE